MWIVRPRLAVSSRRWSSTSPHSVLASRCASNTTYSGKVQSLPSTGRLLPAATRRCYHQHHHRPSLAGGSSSPPPTATVSRTKALTGRWNDTCGGARHRKRSLSTKTPNTTTTAATTAAHDGVVPGASPSTTRGGVGVGSSVGAESSPREVDSAALLRRMATYMEEDAGAADKLGNAVSYGVLGGWLSLLLCCV